MQEAILYEGLQMTIARDCAALVDATLNMVNTAPRHIKFKDMANAAGVNPTWVTRFAKGDIKKPNIAVVERLNAYLKDV